MNKDIRLAFCKGDFFAILLVAAIAAIVLAAFIPDPAGASGSVAQVFQAGALVREISLDEEARMQISGDYSNTIAVEDGRVAIVESDCPGADCVHSGWIASPGRSIVCLPNRVEVRIAGASDVDFVVG